MPLNFDYDPLADAESAVCPNCHETFYAPRNHDPLKRHMDYCTPPHEDWTADSEDVVVWSAEPGRAPVCGYCGFAHDPDDPEGCGF